MGYLSHIFDHGLLRKPQWRQLYRRFGVEAFAICLSFRLIGVDPEALVSPKWCLRQKTYISARLTLLSRTSCHDHTGMACCFSPALPLLPSSSMTVSYPSGRLCMNQSAKIAVDCTAVDIGPETATVQPVPTGAR